MKQTKSITIPAKLIPLLHLFTDEQLGTLVRALHLRKLGQPMPPALPEIVQITLALLPNARARHGASSPKDAIPQAAVKHTDASTSSVQTNPPSELAPIEPITPKASIEPVPPILKTDAKPSLRHKPRTPRPNVAKIIRRALKSHSKKTRSRAKFATAPCKNNFISGFIPPPLASTICQTNGRTAFAT